MDITEHALKEKDKDVKNNGTLSVSRTIHVMMCQEIGPTKKLALANGTAVPQAGRTRPDQIWWLGCGLHRHTHHSCV